MIRWSPNLVYMTYISCKASSLEFLILALKILIELLSFTWLGIFSQILGGKCVEVFKPYFVVWGILETSEFLFLYFVSFTLNNSVINDDDELFRALYISTASCKFLLCILTNPDFLSRSSKDKFLFWYTISIALSWVLLTCLSTLRSWHIHINGQ